jgi:hypothetical protein
MNSFDDDASVSSVHSFSDDNDNNDDISFSDDDDDDDNDDDEGDIKIDDSCEYDGLGNSTDNASDTEHEPNASTEELYQQCLDKIAIGLALHSPEVRAAVISFVNSIEDGGVVIWKQALCALRNMSFASGCGCSIRLNVNSPSIKFTRKSAS